MNDDQVRVAAAAIEGSVPPDAIVAIYLYGSALAGGLRPDSDLDFALVTARRLTVSEKEHLFDALRPLSRRSLRPGDWRPLEVTVLALPDVRPWRYPPQVDAQYGMWTTMATGTIRSKDDAAAWAAGRLPPDAHGLLDHARALYPTAAGVSGMQTRPTYAASRSGWRTRSGGPPRHGEERTEAA